MNAQYTLAELDILAEMFEGVFSDGTPGQFVEWLHCFGEQAKAMMDQEEPE